MLSRAFIIAVLTLATIRAESKPNAYWSENCSQYASRMVGISPESALEMWQGKQLTLIGEYDNFAQANRMLAPSEGMLVAFHGVHCGVFHHGQWFDSDLRHNGAGKMQYDEHDQWFSGKVRIFVIK